MAGVGMDGVGIGPMAGIGMENEMHHKPGELYVELRGVRDLWDEIA